MTKTLDYVVYSSQRDQSIKKTAIQLRILFNATYSGRADVDFLYKKGLEIKERLENAVDDFWGLDNLVDLKDALEFIDGLHDEETRMYNQRNKEQIYYHLVRLGKL